jgi:GNAT superfamily N-acetyltransferase
MAPTDAPAALVEMGEADVPAGFALSEEVGWNQTTDDWSMLLRLGHGFGVRDDGAIVASAVAFPYPSGFGWIGMVIVHGPYRRRGLSTRLMERTIEELRGRGLVPMLDATPAGQPVYERMGFRSVLALSRWRGEGGGTGARALPPVAGVRDIAELDEAAFGSDRSAVLADLLGRAGGASWLDPGGGYLLSRRGRVATYAGPCVARETDAALALLDAALTCVEGPIAIDVPDEQSEIAKLLTQRGFQRERPLTRMALDHGACPGRPGLVRAIAAPGLG